MRPPPGDLGESVPPTSTIAKDLEFRPVPDIDGLEYLYADSVDDGVNIRIVAARAVPGKREFAIVTPESPLDPTEARTATDQATGGTLEDYQKRFRANVVLSGGYLSSFSPPIPLGLLKSANVAISRPHSSWLFDGLICVESAAPWFEIDRYSNSEQTTKCRDALQAGQLLVQAGNGALHLDDRNQRLVNIGQERAFVCTDHQSRVILGVTTKMLEMPLVNILRSKPFDCSEAISLSGHITAGILIPTLGPQGRLGNTGFTIPDAIIIR
jgi:hypothetical protein